MKEELARVQKADFEAKVPSIKHIAAESIVIGFKSRRFYMRAGNIHLRQRDNTSLLEVMSVPKVPNLKLPAAFVVPRADVVRFLKLDPADIVRFIGTPEGLELWAEEEQDVVLAWVKDELEIHECKELTSSEFPLDYFYNILKTCPAASFRMKIGTDYPVKLSWPIGTSDSVSDARFLLAPRIESDGDTPDGWRDQWRTRHLVKQMSAPPVQAPGPDPLGISGTDDGGTPR